MTSVADSRTRPPRKILAVFHARQEIEAMALPRYFRVRIDMSLLRRRLSTEDRREWSTTEVRHFLLDAGFVPDHDAWVVAEAELGHLLPDEVLAAEAEPEEHR